MITDRGRRVRATAIGVAIALAALLVGYSTGDRCYPTYKADSCLAMVDAVVGK